MQKKKGNNFNSLVRQMKLNKKKYCQIKGINPPKLVHPDLIKNPKEEIPLWGKQPTRKKSNRRRK